MTRRMKRMALMAVVAIAVLGVATVALAAPTIPDTAPPPSSHQDGRASSDCTWCHTVTTTPPPAPADTTAPSTAISGIPTGWSRTGVTFALGATDAGSGVAASYYRLGAGAQITYAGPVTVAAAGATTVTYWSADRAGNIEVGKTATVRVDGVAPVTLSNAAISYPGTATIALSASDVHSGVASTSWSLDGAAAVSGTSVVVTAPGSHALTFYSADVAGNVETAKTVAFTIATPVTPPVSEPPTVTPPVTEPPVITPPITLPATGAVSIEIKRPERRGRWMMLTGRMIQLVPHVEDDDEDEADDDEYEKRGLASSSVRLEYSVDGITFADTGRSTLTNSGGSFRFAMRGVSAGYYRVASADGSVTSRPVRLTAKMLRTLTRHRR